MLTAIYPGTFDPITYGHHDIIKRGCKLVDRLIVAVSNNSNKNTTFDAATRCNLIKSDLTEYPDHLNNTVVVKSFSQLLVNFAQLEGATIILRGLRAISDFEYEVQMAANNARMAKNVETVFLSASENFQFVSSSLVREIAQLEGDVSTLVSPTVQLALQQLFATTK